MSRALLPRLLALAALILALAAVPAAPAATVRAEDDTTEERVLPALDLDLDLDDDADDDPCAVAEDEGDEDDEDGPESDAETRAVREADDDAEPRDDAPADDDAPSDDDADDRDADDSDDDADDEEDCEGPLSLLTRSLRVRLADILRSGVDGGAFRVTGPATVREELLLGGGGAKSSRRGSRAKSAKVVGSASKTLRGAGRVHLVVRLSAAGRRAVRRTKGRPKLTLRTTIRSASGRTQTRTRKIVVRKA